MDDVLVIGGGAAGMIAAWRAASLGASTRLLEKNGRLGLKIHISGGGKCNITHGGEMEPLRRAFQPNEARFLHACFRRFTNEDALELMRARGVTVHTRPDGRVFPDSGRAEDVVDALAWHMTDTGVRLHTRVAVTGIGVDDGTVTGAWAGGQFFPSHTVILGVGGSSYPKTGTTGDGFTWARDLGHTIVRLRAALAPIYLADGEAGKPGRRADWSGVALRDCILRARSATGKEVARWRDDLLFTHQGLSGPTALGISRTVALAQEAGPVTLDADLLPDTSVEAVIARIAESHGVAGRRAVRTLLGEWLPERLVPEALLRADIDSATALNQLPRKNRNRLAEELKRWSLGPVRVVPLERGEVTAGGVALEEVDPQTMNSRKVRGLYLAGEILDLAGPVGGYNLQAAFSTGYVAGESATRAARASAEG